MNFDYLKVTQQHDRELPILNVGDAYQRTKLDCGTTVVVQPRFKHAGSFTTAVSVKINGSRLTMEGNPSKYSRLDNLDGIKRLDDCFDVFNNICDDLKLPHFTKCTRKYHYQGEEGRKTRSFSDGATIQRMDINTNFATGGHSKDVIRMLSTQRYRNSIPKLHTNGCTTEWKSPLGKATYIYPSCYDKANELMLHAIPHVRRHYGEDSNEYRYITTLQQYCEHHGIVRMEQKLQSAFLRRNDLQYWGLFDDSALCPIHEEFISLIFNKQVPKMDITTIAEQLMNEGVCTDMRAANATAGYAYAWMSGKQFDFTKSQVQTHRARLRRIHIDIKDDFDLYRHSPVITHRSTNVTISPVTLPTWYAHIKKPTLKAA